MSISEAQFSKIVMNILPLGDAGVVTHSEVGKNACSAIEPHTFPARLFLCAALEASSAAEA